MLLVTATAKYSIGESIVVRAEMRAVVRPAALGERVCVYVCMSVCVCVCVCVCVTRDASVVGRRREEEEGEEGGLYVYLARTE